MVGWQSHLGDLLCGYYCDTFLLSLPLVRRHLCVSASNSEYTTGL